MRARLIVNPRSGADRAPELLPRINERLRTIVRDLDITITTEAADIERAARRAVDEGCDALYIAGGDGTLNAALRALPEDRVRACPIGVIPFGTGNDFVKALDLGEDPEAAVESLLDRRVVDADLGLLNERPFANTSAGGFIADVSATLTEALKDVAGKLAFVIGGARALLDTEPFTARLTVHGGDGSAPDGLMDVQMFAVCNSQFIGGGYVLTPGARIDDGVVDVLVVPRMSTFEFIGVLQRIAAGVDVDHPGIRRFRASSFDLELGRGVRVNTDGELFEAEACRYRVRPSAARFFCGPAPHTVLPPRRL